MKQHAGKILLDYDIIPRLLGFDGGKLHYIGRSEEYNKIVMIIEHRDMPEVRECDPIPIVTPEYILPWHRVTPPKKLLTKIEELVKRIWRRAKRWKLVG